MKKAICIILSVFLVIIALCFVGAGILAHKGISVTQGRVLITSNDSYMLIDENGSPIVMHNTNDKEDLFQGLSTGDEILVIHGPIMESFPAQTGTYYCKKLGDGEFEDIPEQTIKSLTELNYMFDVVFKGQKVECEGEDFKFSLLIPDGWNYEKVTPTYNLPNIPADSNGNTEDFLTVPDMNPREIIFWYENDKENYISVKYETAFGVCGTGLESKTIVLGGKEATMGIYDGKEAWDFITFGKFDAKKGTYCTWNYGDEEWYSIHGEQIMEILDTIEYQ